MGILTKGEYTVTNLEDGKDAKLLYLTASSQVQAFDKDNKPKTTQAITISAKLQNASGTATFTAIPYIGNIAQTAITLGGTGNNRTLLPSQWTNTQWTTIAITATLGSLTDTISIIKVKDGMTGPKGDPGNQGIPGIPGADGRTPYTHWAYAWSEDGTDRFTTVYPGENLLLGTLPNNWPTLENKRAAGSSTTTIAENGNILVTANGASPYYFAGNFATSQILSDDFISKIKGKTIVASADIAFVNQLTTPTNGLGISIYCWDDTGRAWQPNSRKTIAESETISIAVSIPENIVNILVAVRGWGVTPNSSYEISRMKLEINDSSTIYTPAPSEDYANAYPTYTGTYTDYTETDSTNPTDYTWVRTLGQTPVVHPAWSWSKDGTDRFTTVYPQENLILGSADFSSGLLSSQSIVIDGTEHGIKNKIVKCTVPADGLSYYDAWTYRAYGATKTGKYTLMFKAKASVDRATLTSFFYNPNTTTNMVNSQGQSSTRSDGQSSFNLTTEWQDIWVTWTQSETASAKSMILARCSRGPQDIDFYMTEPILVEGSVVPTIYTPSPSEDYANAYPTYEGTYTDYSDTASQNPADYTWRRIIGESGQDGIAGEDGSNGINGDGQLVFNNRYERWPVSTSSSDNLVQTGWSYNANIEIIDAKSDFPAQKIARTKQRGSGTVQFWTTGIPVVPGTYVRWRGQVLTTEDMTPVGSKSFACARFFKSDVPDATSSAAASEINGERTSVYLRHTGLADVGNSPVVISQDIPVITTAGIEYDFEVVMEVPEGAAWLKVSSYADWISPTQQYEYRNFTVVAYQKGDNGLPAYVHNAWANSSDGTVDFTTVYPGENILLGSQPEITMIGNGLENQLPSNRYLLFSDSNLPAADRLTLADLGFKTGDKITFSAEYEISGSGFSGEFSFRLGSAPWVLVSPGKARIKITKAGTFKIQETVDITEDMLGNTYLDSRLDKVPTTVNITVRNRKLEKGGNLNPIYTPSPTDDPSGAYIKYMGTCSNHSETAPTEPSVYHWEVDPTYLKAITDGKVDQDSYEDEKGNIYEILDGKAGTDEFQSLKDQANALQNSYEAFLSDGGKYEHDLESLENRAVGLINQLNDKIAQYEFINTYIRLGEEGLVIGAQNDPMKMLLTKDTLSFIDNGKTVAYFSGQSFYINRGAIVESLQVGSHKMTKIDGNNTVFQFIG